MTLLLDTKLKTSLVPTVGSGSATFTRATTKMFKNDEGRWITIKSGAVGLAGARVVQNLILGSEDLTNASWALLGSASRTASTLTLTASESDGIQQITTTPQEISASKTFTVSAIMSVASGTLKCRFKCTHSAVSDYFSSDITVTTTPIRYEFTKTFTSAAGNGYVNVGVVQSTTPNSGTISITQYALEDVTGQEDQTASEYVSVGVESAPYYHGPGADGIKYFNTNKDGSPIESSAQKGALIDPASKTNTMLYCRDLRYGSADSDRLAWQVSSGLGANLVSNGDFATDTGWAKDTGVTISGGVCSFSAVAANQDSLLQAFSPDSRDKILFITITIKNYVSGSIYVLNGAGTTKLSGNGTFTQSWANGGNNNFIIKAAEAGTTLDIDDITVQLAAIQVALTGTGIDGVANSCSRLTAGANNATILQTITAAAAAGCTGFDVKRVTGTGAVYITRDNVNWTDITSLINTSTFSTVAIENTSVTNPIVGFKFATSGDEIIVDAGRNHLGTKLCEPIFTTSAAVTRAAEPLTYQISGNFSYTEGTILATFTPLFSGSWPSGAVVGKAGAGLFISSSNSGAQSADGTNTVNGATGTPANSSIRIGCRWSGSSLEAFSADPLLNVGTAGSYDGSFNLSTIAINPGAAGYIKDVKVYDASLSDAEIKTAWSLLDSQTFLPAFSNLPIYKAGAIIHVEPDPEPVDPEPTPIFATDFTGWTVGANGVEDPQYFVGTWACVFQFTGSDSATGFGVPTAAPLYAQSGAGSWGTGLGLQNINTNSSGSYFHYSANTKAGVAGRFTHDIIDTTVRGVATKGLEIKIPSPGSASEFIQQAWFQIYRDVDQPDLTEFTTRFEVKLPDLSSVLPYAPTNGRLIILDYKSGSIAGGDFRYLVQVTRYGVSSYRWWLAIDNRGNRTHSSAIFCDMINDSEEVPQLENFTFEFSLKRAYSASGPAAAYSVVSGANAGKARVRIRRESDSVTTWRTIFDASESGIAAYNALNGSSNHDTSFGVSTRTNRHMGYYGDRMQRLMHGNYARKLAADCTVVLQKFRIHNSFDV